jgi:predicted O-methyltransferase YrrM
MLELAERAYNRRANQSVEELAWLLDILSRRKLRRVLEIGCQDGGTFWAWSQIATADAQLLGIDWDPVGKLAETKTLPSRGRQKVKLIEADSSDPATRDTVCDWLGSDYLDFLFIDGDHSAIGVRADWSAYSTLVRPGGLVAFHDITSGPSNGVEAFWAELKARYRTDEKIDPGHRNMERMGIGVLYL